MVTRFLLVGFAHQEADIGEFVVFSVQFGSQEHNNYLFNHEGAQRIKDKRSQDP
jgi:hypothetical protein